MGATECHSCHDDKAGRKVKGKDECLLFQNPPFIVSVLCVPFYSGATFPLG